MLDALLADPCLARFDPEKRCYLLTDWSALGFDAVHMQPADDAPSIAAVKREMAGGSCKFLKAGSKLRLKPAAFCFLPLSRAGVYTPFTSR